MADATATQFDQFRELIKVKVDEFLMNAGIDRADDDYDLWACKHEVDLMLDLRDRLQGKEPYRPGY